MTCDSDETTCTDCGDDAALVNNECIVIDNCEVYDIDLCDECEVGYEHDGDT